MIEIEKVMQLLAIRRQDLEAAYSDTLEFRNQISSISPEYLDNASKQYTTLLQRERIARAKVKTLESVIDMATEK